MPFPLPGDDWVWLAAGGVLALLGVAIAWWALLRDRARGRQRCPRCWYEVAAPGATPAATTCPECGRTGLTPAAVGRTRRRWGIGAVAIIMIVAAAMLPAVPTVRRNGVRGSLPNSVLLAAWRLAGEPEEGWAYRELSSRLSWNRLPASLEDQLLGAPDGPFAAFRIRAVWPRGATPWVEPRWPRPYQHAVVVRAGAVRDSALSYEVWHEDPGDPVPVFGTPAMIAVPVDVRAPAFNTPPRRTVFYLPVQWVERLEDAITPDASEALTGAVRNALELRLLEQPTSRRLGVLIERYHAGPGTSFAFTLEFVHDGIVKARAECSPPSYVFGTLLPVEGDTEALRSAMRSGTAGWTVRIRGDGFLALRDWTATSFWAGSYEIPFESLVR